MRRVAILEFSAALIAGTVFDEDASGTCLQLARQDVRLTPDALSAVLERLESGDVRRRARVAAARRRLVEGLDRPDALAARADLRAAGFVSDQLFFHVLGFSRSISVDASAFEGADVVHDLNQPGLAGRLPGPVAFAVETGTAEHVFHLPHFLANIGESLAPAGRVLHIVPANNYLDHGFYQFSPTLFHDYYRANGYDVRIRLLETDTEDWSAATVSEYEPGSFDRRDRLRFAGRYVLLQVLARKTPASTVHGVPQQRIYGERVDWHPDGAASWLRRSAPVGTLVGPFTPDGGACWYAGLPAGVGAGDAPDALRRSAVVLVEDDRVLGPPHSLHDDIRRLGQGRYSHWDGGLRFSTSDGSDPNVNGRSYHVRLLR